MWLRILGLPDGVPQWWLARNMDDADGAAWLDLLSSRLPGYAFSVDGTPLAEAPLPPPGEGSRMTVVARPARGTAASRGPGPEVCLVVEAGPDAGLLAPLARSGLTVGRNHATMRVADPYLSAPHFEVTVDPEGVRIVHLGGRPTRGGTRADDRPQTGSDPWTRGSSSFRLARGRPCPLGPREELPDLTLDPGPEPSPPNLLMQAVMALGPLLIGTVLVLLTGMWHFMLFSVISVGVATAMWLQHRSARSAHARRIARAARQVAAQLETLAPAPGTLALAARSAAPGRFGHPTARQPPPLVRWGTGTTNLPLAASRSRSDWSAWTRTSLPVVTVLAPGGTTHVRGRRSTLDAMCHWLVIQLCRDAVAAARGVLVRTLDGSSWLAAGRAAREGTAVLMPGADPEGVPARWHRVVMETGADPAGGQDGHVRLFPDAGRATADGVDYDAFHWHGMSASTAGWLLDELGATARPGTRHMPPRMELPEVQRRDLTAEALQASLSGGEDPVVLDLVDHGPHALIAGTTGSGKSELLLTVLSGLSAAYPPSEVSFVLMDFKGGSTFSPLSRLPHTMSVETNLVEAESLRTFDALTAELRRREELFLAHRCVDYVAFRRAHPHQALPRLVVAIDELRVLVDDHPQAATVLARLAATGRSLGFHLLLATQRSQGAVGPDVRSNLGTVVCLRTATEQESWDLLGCADAHTIDAAAPGTGFIRHGGTPPRRFQAGRYAVPPGPPDLVPWTPGQPVPADVQDGTAPADWARIVESVCHRIEREGAVTPPPVVLPALPDDWTPSPGDRRERPQSIVVGLADLPRDQHQTVVRWTPGEDLPAAWIGTETGGLQRAAGAVLGSLAALDSPSVSSGSAARTVVLHGEASPGPTPPGDMWEVLEAGQATPDRLAQLMQGVGAGLAAGCPVRLVVTAWGRWAGLRVGTGYETVEDHLTLLLRDHSPPLLAAALFGGRELAGGRILGLVPHRLYVPAGTTPEHRMVWPTLQRVREVPGRAVMVAPAHPAPGVAVQLALDP
ncbi:MAG TPA: FtsK/SpoIIIE domain-containing protein [Citricoccus sp.]